MDPDIVGPADRFTDNSISGILEEMKYSAARISEELTLGGARL